MAKTESVGGNGGEGFDDGDGSNLDIVSLLICQGDFIDGLQIFYQDKNIGPVSPSGPFIITRHGAEPKDQFDPCWQSFQMDHEHGEVITYLVVSYALPGEENPFVHTMTIHTSTGREEIFGGRGGYPGPHTARLPPTEGQRIY